MIDLDDLIEEARRLEGDYSDNHEVVTHMSVLADALESVRAERDAALARIAELEKELALLQVPDGYPKRPSARAWAAITDRANTAEARIAEAAKLHQKYTYYDLEDSCPDTTDEHREEHHHEASDDIGEFYCDQMPTGDVCCDSCRDVNGDRMEWPCETAVALGLNEGEVAGDDR